MPKTTLSLTSFCHKPNKKNQLGNLDSVGNKGLLVLFEEFCNTVNENKFVDKEKQHYIKLIATERIGRAVFATFESGYYGNPGNTYDVRTHKSVHTRNDYESATTLTRVGLVLPPGGTTAVFFFEREGTYGAGPRVFDMFKDSLIDSFPNDYFPAQVIVEPKAWQKDADLRKITVTASKWRNTVGGSVSPVVMPMGQLRQELRPAKGLGFFPRAIRDSILNKQISMSVYLGFPAGVDTETKVELVKDKRAKTFIVGREKSPSVLLMLTEDGKPRLKDTEIQSKIFEEAESFYKADGLSWESKWETGKVAWVKPDVTWNHKFI